VSPWESYLTAPAEHLEKSLLTPSNPVVNEDFNARGGLCVCVNIFNSVPFPQEFCLLTKVNALWVKYQGS
jgi:hypothetical protein